MRDTFRDNLLLEYRVLGDKIERAWYLVRFELCCTLMAMKLDSGNVHITGYSRDMDKYRLRLDNLYIIVCPYCAGPVKVLCREKGQKDFYQHLS